MCADWSVMDASNKAVVHRLHVLQAVVDMLLAVNASINAKDNTGRTALLEAAKAGHDDILSLLLAKGAKLAVDEQTQVGG